MYVAPIVRARTPASPVVRRMAGAPTLLVAAFILVPWLAIALSTAALVLLVRGIVLTPGVLARMIDYAGEVVLGR